MSDSSIDRADVKGKKKNRWRNLGSTLEGTMKKKGGRRRRAETEVSLGQLGLSTGDLRSGYGTPESRAKGALKGGKSLIKKKPKSETTLRPGRSNDVESSSRSSDFGELFVSSSDQGNAARKKAKSPGKASSFERVMTMEEGLPIDCWRVIYSHLDAETRWAASMTSRGWRKVALLLKTGYSVHRIEALSNSLPVILRFLASNSPRLASVDLSTCPHISPSDLKFVPASVQRLILDVTQTNDHCLQQMPALPNLSHMSLQWCIGITDAGLPFLPSNLLCLNLNGCVRITKMGIKSIPTTIVDLNLSGCLGVTDATIQFIPAAGLTSLNLTNCSRITDIGMQFLPTGLQVLNLYGCNKITDSGLQQLPLGLVDLNLSLCNKLSDLGLQSLPRTLRRLNLSFCKWISGVGLRSLPPQLEFLSLRGCSNVTDRGLQTLPCSFLSHLDISCVRDISRIWEGPKITDAGLDHLPPKLISLNLCGCQGITDGGLRQLPSSIETLNLSDTQITDVGLGHLPESLRDLSLRDCRGVTDVGVEFLRPPLENLCVEGCPVLSNEGLEHIPETLRMLQISYSAEYITEKGLALLPRGCRYTRGGILDVDLEEMVGDTLFKS